MEEAAEDVDGKNVPYFYSYSYSYSYSCLRPTSLRSVDDRQSRHNGKDTGNDDGDEMSSGVRERGTCDAAFGQERR